MKIKKVILLVVLLTIIFSNLSVFGTSSGDFYYQGTPVQNVSGTTYPTYNASASTSGVGVEMIPLLQMGIYCIAFIMILLVALYFYLLRGRIKKSQTKVEDRNDDPIKRRD